MTDYTKPIPAITPEMRPFFDAAKQHELRVQRCSACGTHRFPARAICSACLSTDVEWVPVSGRGEVFSFNVMHQVYHPGFAAEVPYAVVIVQLAEGAKMVSNLVGVQPHDIRIGMPVRVVFEDVSDAVTLPKFARRKDRGMQCLETASAGRERTRQPAVGTQSPAPPWQLAPPTPRAQRFAQGIARAILWLQVGAVTVRGRQHLAHPGPRLIIANHSHYVDGAPFVLLLAQPPRFMVARGVFRFAGGLLARAVAACGAFCVDLDPGKGAPARELAVRILTAGQTLVLFPEGWINMDGVLGPLKNGAARAAVDAARRLGRPIPIVPVALRYGRYPGAWIRALPCPLQFLIVLLGGWRYRRGLTLTVGAPISSDDLRGRGAQATAMLRQALIALAEPPLTRAYSPGDDRRGD